MVAKYAGQWDGYPGEPLTVRIQKAILRSRWWRGPVTVYGDAPGQAKHIVPFFTSVLTSAQIQRGAAAVLSRRERQPRRILFVGRLSVEKNVDCVLRAVASVSAEFPAIECTITGAGPHLSSLKALASELGIANQVTFTGAVPFNTVLSLYESSDILVLASQTEGWGKAVAEAMAFGLVCIGANAGFSRKMLADGRGVLVGPRDEPALAQALRHILANPAEYHEMRLRAAAWAQQFSLESLRAALQELLSRSWDRPNAGRGNAALYA
jgi:glycosyltransferase involved in cell wall biosynthesis